MSIDIRLFNKLVAKNVTSHKAGRNSTDVQLLRQRVESTKSPFCSAAIDILDYYKKETIFENSRV